MIEVTVTGAPRAVASSLLAAIGPAKDSSAIERALKTAGYDRVKSETDYPSNRELRTTA